ncbi:hypothetical protein EsDP_00007427 [Epichloe bromicola]|uniref:Uncharacterized protein n=1 Tax=Epichloe bromicola TaxID=79588 RepID=A0ABQ0D0H1_9HYPO
MRLPLAFFLSLVAIVAAADDSATCGSTEYSSDAVAEASDAACRMVKNGDAVGSNSYPHQYKNFEKFDLRSQGGPFYEFPILQNGRVYSGGKPGPDRVIITRDCRTAGVLTHQGASGNAFRECNIRASASSAVIVGSQSVPAFCSAMIMFAFLA